MPTDNNDIKDSIDQILSRKLLSFEEAPPPGAWSNISKQIGTNSGASTSISSWKNMFFITATVVIISAALLYLFSGRDKKTGLTKKEIITTELKTNSSSTMETHQENPGNQAPVEFKSDLPGKPTGAGLQKSSEQNSPTSDKKFESIQVPQNSTIQIPEDMPVEMTPALAPVTPVPSATLSKDSMTHHNSVDSIKKVVKPKSFYDKQRKDTSMKYQDLFKKK